MGQQKARQKSLPRRSFLSTKGRQAINLLKMSHVMTVSPTMVKNKELTGREQRGGIDDTSFNREFGDDSLRR